MDPLDVFSSVKLICDQTKVEKLTMSQYSFLYYPTLAFAVIDKIWHEGDDDEDSVDPEDVHIPSEGESEPLLRR